MRFDIEDRLGPFAKQSDGAVWFYEEGEAAPGRVVWSKQSSRSSESSSRFVLLFHVCIPTP